jgi:hypothetical protein
MRPFLLVPLFTQAAVSIVTASPSLDNLSLCKFDAGSPKGASQLTTTLGAVSFLQTGNWFQGDKFTLLIDDKPIALKGSELGIRGFGTLGGKDFLIVDQSLSAGAGEVENNTFILVRDQNIGVKIISLKPNDQNYYGNDIITMKDKLIIFSGKGFLNKGSGTITWDGTNISFSPYVRTTPIKKFDLSKLAGKNIGELINDPSFMAIFPSEEHKDIEYRFAVGDKFKLLNGFYCAKSFPRHMGGGNDDAIISISKDGKKVHIAWLVNGKELAIIGFSNLNELCPWMKDELFKLVDTFHENTGGYPDCNLPFPGSDAYYAQLPRAQFEHQVTLAAIRAKEANTKSLLWKNRIQYNTVSQDIPKETQKYQEWAMNELRPRYVEFVTIAGAYVKRFDQIALRDLLIKSNTQSLMK